MRYRQRARLVSSLIGSLKESDETDVEQAWIDEVHKRAQELETGAGSRADLG
ncbi:MAG: addiction module protein [Myxococcales bacterium]